MHNKKQKIIFISWAPYCSRSDNLAREFGGKSFLVYSDFLGSNYFTIFFKYAIQTIKSLVIFLREKPDVVFVMSPPVIACMPAFIYSLFSKQTIFIIDAHTAAFTHQRWADKDKLNSFFASRAAFTIVTNEPLGDIVEKRWGGEYEIIRDVPVKFKFPSHKEAYFQLEKKDRKIITLVNSFANDEPLQEFLEGIKAIPDIQVYITGKIKKDFRQLISLQPSNIHFTDFLPDASYAQLIKDSDLICALTTRDNTMQRGAYEAIYLGKPVLTSNWEILKNNFPIGTVHVANTPEAINNGLKYALDNLGKLTVQAKKLKNDKLLSWVQTKESILECIARH